MRDYRAARDRQGPYHVNWSMLEEADIDDAPSRIEFIPFSKGDARVPSLPADETMYCGVGDEDGLTHAVVALRVGDRAVHVAMSAERMRQFARCLAGVADMIDQQRKGRR